MKNDSAYDEWMNQKERAQELLCNHCGACCGAYEDPCQHLAFKDGKSFCQVYDQRLGEQRTLSGVVFNCISIRQKLFSSWPGDEKCGYKKSFH